MAAPNFDWLASLTLIQQNFLRDKYKDMWECYTTFGYTVLMYDYGYKVDQMYEDVMSVKLTDKLPLPKDIEEAVRLFYEAQLAAGNLSDIVVPVANYHIDLYTQDARVLSELKKSFNNIPIVMQKKFDDNLLRNGNSLAIVDDLDKMYDDGYMNYFEIYCCPYLRRSVIGWRTPALDKTSENVIANAIRRFKPCKQIRDL